MKTEKIDRLLNASGFRFQLAIEDAVRKSDISGTWKVTGREHPWRTGDSEGYIDLILSSGTTHLVLECKRSRDADWLFLMPDNAQMERSHARVCWTDTKPHRRALKGWGDTQVYPRSPETEFCVVRGQGEKDTPLLERMAAGVVQATDGLARQYLELGRESRTTHRLLPVIVTSASLFVSQFSPGGVSLQTGEPNEAKHQEVSHLRFRKSLAGPEVPFEFEPETLEDLAYGSIRTVFVVQATGLVDWLRSFQTSASDATSPWVTAREAEEAFTG